MLCPEMPISTSLKASELSVYRTVYMLYFIPKCSETFLYCYPVTRKTFGFRSLGLFLFLIGGSSWSIVSI